MDLSLLRVLRTHFIFAASRDHKSKEWQETFSFEGFKITELPYLCAFLCTVWLNTAVEEIGVDTSKHG